MKWSLLNLLNPQSVDFVNINMIDYTNIHKVM